MPSSPSSTGSGDQQRPLDAPSLATALTATLDLRHPPVALAFVAGRPDGIADFSGAVPSACTFWRRCEDDVFFAAADAHFNCPIGALTMGFAMPDAQRDALMALVGTMGEMGYVDPAEAAHIPSVPGEKSGIVYGPLARFPTRPDVVLAWVTAAGAMLLDEATGASRWTSELGGTITFGRPSCAALAVAIAGGFPVHSVGCAGMRTFTEIEGELQLAVLPYPALHGLEGQLAAVGRINAEMDELYLAKKIMIESAAES